MRTETVIFSGFSATKTFVAGNSPSSGLRLSLIGNNVDLGTWIHFLNGDTAESSSIEKP